MTTQHRDRIKVAGIWLAFLFIVSAFMGYQVGADRAHADNGRDNGRAQAAESSES